MPKAITKALRRFYHPLNLARIDPAERHRLTQRGMQRRAERRYRDLLRDGVYIIDPQTSVLTRVE